MPWNVECPIYNLVNANAWDMEESFSIPLKIAQAIIFVTQLEYILQVWRSILPLSRCGFRYPYYHAWRRSNYHGGWHEEHKRLPVAFKFPTTVISCSFVRTTSHRTCIDPSIWSKFEPFSLEVNKIQRRCRIVAGLHHLLHGLS